MKLRVMVTGLLAAAIAVPAQAQTSSCASGATQDACQKAVDLLNFMTPQLSTALASGNPTLGQGGALGGLGHFSIDIRASAVNGSLPQASNVGFSPLGAQHSTFTSKNQYIPGVSLDAGVGLWRGISLGVTHVGGIDGIVTMTYLPNISTSGSSGGSISTTGGSEKFGYGARLGILEESAVTPGLSVAWVQRDLPVVSFGETVNASGANPGGTIDLDNLAIKTSDWRITAAKSFNIVGLSLGYGQDKYNANSLLSVTVDGGGSSQTPNTFAMTRTNYFVGMFINLYIFKIEGEYGQVTGGSLPAAFNTFGSDAAKSRSYFTVGLRFGR
jgi:hypothetical protein